MSNSLFSRCLDVPKAFLSHVASPAAMYGTDGTDRLDEKEFARIVRSNPSVRTSRLTTTSRTDKCPQRWQRGEPGTRRPAGVGR